MTNKWPAELESILYESYKEKVQFEKDRDYLEGAYKEIEYLWHEEYKKINPIKFVILSEAPLWGDNKAYIYNPNARQTSFLSCAHIRDDGRTSKGLLLETLRERKVLILDIFPFSFNNDTQYRYQTMKRKDYKKLLMESSAYHLSRKLDMILNRGNADLKFIFRYARVKAASEEHLNDLLKRSGHSIVREMSCISGNYGNVDTEKLKKMLTKEKGK